MGVVFETPALAWGALAALIPVLVHLIQRRRPRPHPFAAIELVRRSQKRNVRRLRLKRLLLLAARTAILLAVPFALARPHLSSSAAAAAASPRGPAATALVIDASMSMSWLDDGGDPLLARAQSDARDVLAGTGTEEPVTVLACDGAPPVSVAPGYDRSAARRSIDELVASRRAADVSGCLAAAARALGESTVPGKRIYVFTDLAASGWRLDAPAPSVPLPGGTEVRPEVVVVDAARGRELPNLAVSDLVVAPAPEIGPRAVSFAFTVRNFGAEPVKDVAAELVVGDEVVAKGFLDVPARGAAVKRLAHRFPRGGSFPGRIRLAADRLEADDQRAFVARVPRDLQALVVNGSPSPVKYRDEAFFVDAALRMGGASPVHATTVDAETFPAHELAGLDLLLLLNVRAPDAALSERIRMFVEEGGGLFVSLGENVEPDPYNRALGALLPRPLHLAKAAGERGRDEIPPARFGTLETNHPVLQLFSGEAREGFEAARTYRYFLLQPGREGEGTRVLASYDDGAPALVERAVGKGRVILYTSTVDRDWSDWPIQTSFLPTMQQAAAYLARSLEERAPKPGLVGTPQPLELPPGATVKAVLGPDGRERALSSGRPGEPARVDGVDLPGLYAVRGTLGDEVVPRDLPELAFAVHVDSRESDTSRLDPEELKAHLGGETAEVARDPAADRRKETSLWSVLLAMAVAAFLIEGALVRR